jgi:Protein of unknown function (DUF3040)
MGLGPNEQRLLDQIERALHGSDPKLAAKLATFNRLTFHEAMPLRERLLHSPSRVVRWAPVAMAAFVMFMILISVTVLSRIGPAKGSSGAACGIAWLPGRPAAESRAQRGQRPPMTAAWPWLELAYGCP